MMSIARTARVASLDCAESGGAGAAWVEEGERRDVETPFGATQGDRVGQLEGTPGRPGRRGVEEAEETDDCDGFLDKESMEFLDVLLRRRSPCVLSFGANWVVWSLWLSGLHVYLAVGGGREPGPTRVASLVAEKRSHENILVRTCN
jgi:hypothetical protein